MQALLSVLLLEQVLLPEKKSYSISRVLDCLGTFAAILSTALFAYLGMTLTRLGSRTQTTSHKEVIYKISGPYLGVVVDAIIVFTLFGVGVVMLAGAGSVLNQQFGFEPYIGNLLMAVLVSWDSHDECKTSNRDNWKYYTIS